ncbi:hypothetical protein B0I35DRAFT_514807 [Stachybotrys elegans]|uniref:Heterokaryon incompatibility domain-containing protein n=1 Tax=Stachybotrys elegans TaxID=80388 RepID=A0A8K0SNT5_9HYPO|nr:hypothetical protein B0I35DRAFT_514807 [Stachybotrys elegans]
MSILSPLNGSILLGPLPRTSINGAIHGIDFEQYQSAFESPTVQSSVGEVELLEGRPFDVTIQVASNVSTDGERWYEGMVTQILSVGAMPSHGGSVGNDTLCFRVLFGLRPNATELLSSRGSGQCDDFSHECRQALRREFYGSNSCQNIHVPEECRDYMTLDNGGSTFLTTALRGNGNFWSFYTFPREEGSEQSQEDFLALSQAGVAVGIFSLPRLDGISSVQRPMELLCMRAAPPSDDASSDEDNDSGASGMASKAAMVTLFCAQFPTRLLKPLSSLLVAMHWSYAIAVWALYPKVHASPTSAEFDADTLKHTDVDVAIIGGGSGGINAAINLKDAGASVVVIEKKSQIGGHAETYTNPTTGVTTNAGVVIFENTDVVKRYFDRLAVPNIPITITPSTTGQYDFALRIPIPPLSPEEAAAQQQAISEAVQRYSQNVLPKYPWIDSGYFLPDPVPKELTIPYPEFAAKHNFTALLPLFATFNWYAGNLTTLPALYGLKMLGPGLLQSLFGGFLLSATGDTRSLYDSALQELGASVLLNTTVLNVNRHSGAKGVSILVRQSGQPPRLIRAKKLIVAIPLLLENVRHYDLSVTEKQLFSKFHALGYIAGVGNVPGFNGSFTNVGAQTPFNQPIVPSSNILLNTGSPGDFLFGAGFDTDDVTLEDGKNVVRSNLDSLASLDLVPADAAQSVTFPFISNHRPFSPQVSGGEIKAGFYKRLLNLQGQRNTYWTEDVDNTEPSSVSDHHPKNALQYINHARRETQYSQLEVICDTDAPSHVTANVMGRPVNQADDPARVKRWLQDCLSNHPNCTRASPGRIATSMPTRLLRISEDQRSLRLIEVQANATDYLALSHRWGGANIYQTTLANVEEHKASVPQDKLCSTFRDAIRMTWNLGYRHIWIDSLCIIQDSSQDWLIEAASMATVYRNAVLTISASCATSGDTGLFHDRSSKGVGVNYQIKNGNVTDLIHLVNRKTRPWRDEVIKGPLNTRAWCLQEHWLSRRILHFGRTQRFWECLTGTWEESFSEPLNSSDRLLQSGFIKVLNDFEGRSALTPARPGGLTTAEFTAWYRILEDYCSRDMTNSRDKLPGLSGLAFVFGEYREDAYVAGLWRADLPIGLLWSSYMGRRLVRPADYRAPSWSWAALDGQIDVEFWWDGQVDVGIISAWAGLAGQNPYGMVTSGYIEVEGLAVSIQVGSPTDHKKSKFVWRNVNVELVMGEDEAFVGEGCLDTPGEADRGRNVICLLVLRVGASFQPLSPDVLDAKGEWAWCIMLEYLGDNYKRVGLAQIHQHIFGQDRVCLTIV